MGELQKRAQQGDLNNVDLEEYNKIDKSITTAMITLEKKLPKRGARIWTTELGRLVHQARYYWLLLCQAKGIAYHQNIILNVKKKAKIDDNVTDIHEIWRRLQSTWTKIDTI